MRRKKRLGQHFLNSKRIARNIVLLADITPEDTVYEIGTGRGILTPMLCKDAKRVISIDVDRVLFEDAKSSLSHVKNLTLQYGDGFKKDNEFTVFVSNLPYSKSRTAMEWLAQTPFSHGVIMVQQEFAQKLTRSSKRKAVSVIANHALDITEVCHIDRNNFDPPPMVDSVLLRILKKTTISKVLIHTINRMFSYRKKTVKNILKEFGMQTTINKRLDELSDAEIIRIAKEIAKK